MQTKLGHKVHLSERIKVWK